MRCRGLIHIENCVGTSIRRSWATTAVCGRGGGMRGFELRNGRTWCYGIIELLNDFVCRVWQATHAVMWLWTVCEEAVVVVDLGWYD